MSKLSIARKVLTMAGRYVQQNPEKVRRVADRAARFADERTHGRYRRQIDSAVRKVDQVSGTGRARRRGDPAPYREDPRHRW